ncbi:HEAT repeat domain-containing protein [Candidatus Poribacteria bacterium]
MNTDRTRSFLNGALKDFRTARDPDDRLHSLWKISQLVEDATDEELHELAAAAIVEEDHRVRGELCYTISRSRKPQLIEVLRGLTQDDDPYVRRSAMTAIGELGGIREATLSAIEPILDDVDELKSALNSLEEKLNHLCRNIEESEDIDSALSEREIIVDDQMKSWETYLRHEMELLRDHSGMYVAIYGEEIVGIGEDVKELAEMVDMKYGSVAALICKIEAEDEPIQMPPSRVILDLQDNSL